MKKAQTWNDNINNVVRDIMFADTELIELMMIPDEYTEDIIIDCVIEGTGNSNALKKCLEVIKPHGKIVLMGNPAGDVELSQSTYWNILRKELKIYGTWNSSYGISGDDWVESLNAMSCGKIDVKPLITHKYPLSDCNKAFEMMKNRTVFFNKVILNMNEEEKAYD